jgi:hypothetical protein
MGSIPEQEGDLQKAAPWAHQAVNFRIDLGDPGKFNYFKYGQMY